VNCQHCGNECTEETVVKEELTFCCTGCKTVYELLQENNLGDFYAQSGQAGIKVSTSDLAKLAVLDDPTIRNRFVLFEDDQLVKLRFKLPQIHCSACIWLLEHLSRLEADILSSMVNFTKKEVTITLKKGKKTVRNVAELLTSIGYEPFLQDQTEASAKKGMALGHSNTLIIKIAVAGFCFGNIMLFAFPEYLGLEADNFKNFFAYLSMALGFPVLFYSGWDYLKNGFLSVKQRYMNMDVPIALGILALFLRSSYEIIAEVGPGYFDSLAGLIFFMLLGKWFQEKTYKTLSFERDYTSYFPLSATVIDGNELRVTKLQDLKVGDRILVKNQELIPADGLLIKGEGALDYSFVTGESVLVSKQLDELVYAGGKQSGKEIEIILTKRPDNSYLTQLWNQEVFTKKEAHKSVSHLANSVSKYFTAVIITITLLTGMYWYFTDATHIWQTITAVLIITCPCALALSIPFTFGNGIRVLGKQGIYLKNAAIIEKLAHINTVVFDKTGTLTNRHFKGISYEGTPLTAHQLQLIKTAVRQSNHPMSGALYQFLQNTEPLHSGDFTFEELPGKGILFTHKTTTLQLGADHWVGNTDEQTVQKTGVNVSINGEWQGKFIFSSSLRTGIEPLIQLLRNQEYKTAVLSGDSNHQEQRMMTALGVDDVKFNCSPHDKLTQIADYQKNGAQVMMVGDGLNDSGALKQSDVGVAVADDVNYFVPACDLILDGQKVPKIEQILRYAKASKKVVIASFILSFLYNIVGLSFAVTANLSPIIAAVLMPISSISVVTFATLMTNWAGKRIFRG
jgi:P-type Cu+ transporter